MLKLIEKCKFLMPRWKLPFWWRRVPVSPHHQRMATSHTWCQIDRVLFAVVPNNIYNCCIGWNRCETTRTKKHKKRWDMCHKCLETFFFFFFLLTPCGLLSNALVDQFVNLRGFQLKLTSLKLTKCFESRGDAAKGAQCVRSVQMWACHMLAQSSCRIRSN